MTGVSMVPLDVLVLVPLVLAARALYLNVRYLKHCPPEFWATRASTAALAFCYIVLFALYEFGVIDAVAYASLGTGLSIPAFELVWNRPTVISAKLTSNLLEAEARVSEALDRATRAIGEAEAIGDEPE